MQHWTDERLLDKVYWLARQNKAMGINPRQAARWEKLIEECKQRGIMPEVKQTLIDLGY